MISHRSPEGPEQFVSKQIQIDVKEDFVGELFVSIRAGRVANGWEQIISSGYGSNRAHCMIEC